MYTHLGNLHLYTKLVLRPRYVYTHLGNCSCRHTFVPGPAKCLHTLGICTAGKCIHTLANRTRRHIYFADAGRHTLAASTPACAVFTDRLVWFGPYSLHPFVPSRASDRNPFFCFCGGREATHDAPLSRHRILIRGRQRAKCYVQ